VGYVHCRTHQRWVLPLADLVLYFSWNQLAYKKPGILGSGTPIVILVVLGPPVQQDPKLKKN